MSLSLSQTHDGLLLDSALGIKTAPTSHEQKDLPPLVSNQNGRKWYQISDTNKSRLVVTAKVLIVAAVVAALVAASVFTIGASLSMSGPFILWTSFLAKGALWGAGCTLGAAGLVGAPLIAWKTNMFKDTGENIKDIAKFTLLSSLGSVISAGLIALQLSNGIVFVITAIAAGVLKGLSK